MQNREVKVTNNSKESFANMTRIDGTKNLNNSEQKTIFSHINGAKTIFSSNLTSVNTANSSSLKGDHIKSNVARGGEDVKKNRISDRSPGVCLSEVNSSEEEAKNFFNIFSLPMYGLSEKSTQTDITGGDIDELIYLRSEVSVLNYKSLSAANPEITKKVFPFLEDRKTATALGIVKSQKDVRPERNFIQIKRKSETEPKPPRSKFSHPTLQEASLNINISSHIHFKPEKRKYKRRQVLVQNSPIKRDDSTGMKSTEMSQIINDVVEEVKHPQIKLTNKYTSESSEIRRDFNDEFNISEIINDIKNISRSNAVVKETTNTARHDPHILIPTTSGLSEDTDFNRFKPMKKKFDAYYFFKCEFKQSKTHLDEEELEKLCRKEWTDLDKETRKIYNINAEREKKIHKINKKKLKEEQTNMKNDDSSRNI